VQHSARVLLAVLLSVVVGTAGVAADAPVVETGSVSLGPGSFEPSSSPTLGPGRRILLTGVIEGVNFEPGICNPAQTGPFAGKCLIFTNSEPVLPGQFKRAHPGQTAFTVCDPCTVDGRTGSFILKISYPNPNNIQITHFTIQGATGDLEGLQGEGTVDFSTGAYTLRYHFQ
jgi:hypothetical protein